MAIKHVDKLLAQECVSQGMLSQEQADQALRDCDQEHSAFKDHLLKKDYISEDQLLSVFSKLYAIPIADISGIEPDKSVIQRVPVRFATYYKCAPVRIEGKTVELACSQPLDVKFQDDIRIQLGLEPKIVLARTADILKAQNQLYGLAADVVDRLSKTSAKETQRYQEKPEEIDDIEQVSDDASVTRLVNQILFDAYQKRATDIHIEPYRNKMRVRYRIDGVLMDANIPNTALEFLPSIVSRMKILSKLSIVEKRLPQDGSAVVKTSDQQLDLRISTIPTPRGESMVIRILPTNVTLLGLDHLGLESDNLKLFRELVKNPHGILLVTGPTGSGKTTTLYACLNEINSPARKIITLEDPIEYEMDGITQIQVNPKIDFTFAAGLRSVLRHDPDIIMVGEIRDLETAEIAIRTALTGHLVFSTLHTNDAASGVTRLVEMGLEPFLVTSSIEAFVAQRLVRTICPKCKEEIKTPLLKIRQEIAESLGMKTTDVRMYTGRGCPHCNKTGFFGRTAIYEILIFNEKLRQAVLERRNSEHIKQVAMDTGMTTLRQDGWRKVVAGITTPEEVMNVTVRDHELDVINEPVHAAGGEVVPARVAEPLEAPPAEADASRVKERLVLDKILDTENQYDSRVYHRVKVKTNIRYAIYHQDKINPQKFRTNDIQHSSVTKDLSAGGVRFVSGYALPIDTILDMAIHIPDGKGAVHCLGKVCRVEDDAFSAMFHLVAFFLDISGSDRLRISEFVKTLVEKEG